MTFHDRNCSFDDMTYDDLLEAVAEGDFHPVRKRRMVEELISRRAGRQAVTVKPLEWPKVYDGYTRSSSHATGVGGWASFVVSAHDAARSEWRWCITTDGDFSEFPDTTVYPTREAAQDAANRWHAARVMEWVDTEVKA